MCGREMCGGWKSCCESALGLFIICGALMYVYAVYFCFLRRRRVKPLLNRKHALLVGDVAGFLSSWCVV